MGEFRVIANHRAVIVRRLMTSHPSRAHVQYQAAIPGIVGYRMSIVRRNTTSNQVLRRLCDVASTCTICLPALTLKYVLITSNDLPKMSCFTKSQQSRALARHCAILHNDRTHPYNPWNRLDQVLEREPNKTRRRVTAYDYSLYMCPCLLAPAFALLSFVRH
jgi:hypothetical protein